MFSNQFLSFCLFLSIFGVLIIRSSTDERVLYQSDFSNAKDWTPERSPGRSKEGWSLYQEEGVYRTCDVDSSSLSSATNLRNVLTKNFTKSAEFTKIHIEATLSIKPCAEISNGGSVKPGCKEVVSVEIGYNSPSETRPQKEILSLESDLNVKAVEFPPDVTKFSISLVDEGVCADLSKFKISVFVCKAKIVNLIEFSETVSKDDIVRTTEKCVDNAVSEKPVKGFCFQGGVWKQPDKNLCLCKPGFEPDSSLISCKSCEPGSYKSETSNGVCQRCPLNSNAYYSAFTECVCSDNFARKDPKDVSLPCLPQPNKPRSLKTTLTTHSQIELSWDQPIMTSYQIDPNPGPIWYTVHCSQPQPQCNGLQYIETNETRITIDKLQADTSFTWRVCAENAVSKFIQAMSNCETLKVATLKMVKVTSLKADVSDNMQLMLYWSEPDSVADSSRVRGGNSYRIKFISPGNSVVVTIVNGTTNCVDRFCSYTIPPTLQPGTYQFQVGFGSPAIFSDPIQVPIDSNLPMSEEIRRLMITVGLLFAVLLMILASCIAIFCCCRQKIDQTHPRLKTTLTGNFYEQYTTIAPPTIQDYSFKVAGFEGGFEEPTLHPDPEALLAKYTRELNENQVLCSYQKLKGKYNEAVELGTYCEESGGSESKMSVGLQHFVPLETMPNCAGSVDSMSMNGYTDLEQFNQQTRRELMIAAATCAQLIHPNVLSLKGFVKRDDESFTVVTEHAELGSLLILLQQGHVTNVSTIIHMARGVACGMRYLQEEGYIHKVLKTSNVLVSQNLVCKISGFSQRAKIENQEKNASLMIPEDLVPWTAPEVLLYQQFSWASDVWSFGVLLWEMLSQGSMPYYDQEIPATQILRVLEAGYRLPMPPNSPSLAYDLMTRCWCGEGNGRPQFASIVEVLETLMKKPLDFGPDFDTSQWLGPANYAMYNAAAASKQPGGMYTPGGTSFRAHQQLSPPATSSPPGSHPYQNTLPTPVSTLLAQINMHQYESLFLMTGIQTIEDLSRLSVHDLKAIGVSSSKHRKRIVQSCSRLTAAASKQNVELDYSVAYGTTSSVNGKSWNTSQLSPGPREQLMSQYV